MNFSLIEFRHSTISKPSSRAKTRTVAVLAVPAGPVRAKMRCWEGVLDVVYGGMSLNCRRRRNIDMHTSNRVGH